VKQKPNVAEVVKQ